MNTFGDRFKKLRLDRNLTQQELAEEFNEKYGYSFTKATISQYENNKRTPEMIAIKRFVDYFNTSLDYLLCNDGYNIKEVVENYLIKEKSDNFELDDIRLILINMIVEGNIVIDEQKLSSEELKLFSNSLEIIIELVKRDRLNNA